MNSGVYEIVNTVTGKRYVGSAKNFAQRWKAHRHHLDRGSHHSQHLQASWAKHGASVFAFQPLLICAPKDLILYEQIAFDGLRPEYNVAPVAGSCLGVKHSAEVRARSSARMMGNKYTLGYRHSPESIQKLSASKIGNTHTKGKPRAQEAVAKTATAHRGMKRSEETRAKISEKAKGRACPPRSAEFRAKMSAIHKGKPKSAEHIAALQAGRAARVVTLEQRIAMGLKMKAAYESGAMPRQKSPEWLAKIAVTLTGRKASPEHRAAQSAAQLGKKRGPYKKCQPAGRQP